MATNRIKGWVTDPFCVALATAGSILAALFLRPELTADPRILWVVGFALLAALVGGMSAPRFRWGVSVFLIAMGLGLVVGLHSPAAFATNQARVTRLP